jgi:hypothetical protein
MLRYNSKMKLTRSHLYFILLALVIFTLVGTNELGIGVFTFTPLTLLAYWLMVKAFE